MRQSACRGSLRVTWRPATCNVWAGLAGWSLRHVQRRVQLTLGLGRREAGARLGTTAPHDLPAAVLRLQRLRGEWDDLAGRGAGQDHVHAARAGAGLEFRQQPVAVARPGGGEGGGTRGFWGERGKAGSRGGGAMIRSTCSSSSTSVSRYCPAALSSSSRTASSPISSSSSRVRVFLYSSMRCSRNSWYSCLSERGGRRAVRDWCSPDRLSMAPRAR